MCGKNIKIYIRVANVNTSPTRLFRTSSKLGKSGNRPILIIRTQSSLLGNRRLTVTLSIARQEHRVQGWSGGRVSSLLLAGSKYEIDELTIGRLHLWCQVDELTIDRLQPWRMCDLLGRRIRMAKRLATDMEELAMIKS